MVLTASLGHYTKRQLEDTPEAGRKRVRRFARQLTQFRTTRAPRQFFQVNGLDEPSRGSVYRSHTGPADLEKPSRTFEPASCRSMNLAQCLLEKPVSAKPGHVGNTVHPGLIASPFQLFGNQTVVSERGKEGFNVEKLLGDPLMRQVWIFTTYCDIEWTMARFHSKVRDSINVIIVHGGQRGTKCEPQEEEAQRNTYKNVRVVAACATHESMMHSSKMMVLFKSDDTVRVVVHTANMLREEFTNMAQAAWVSPSIPRQTEPRKYRDVQSIGGGYRFQQDLIVYLNAYGIKVEALTREIRQYDFRQVRAALVASIPSIVQKQNSLAQVWGYSNLSRTLEEVHAFKERIGSRRGYLGTQHLVCQTSSLESPPNYRLQDAIFRIATPTPPSKGAFCFGAELLSMSIIHHHDNDVQGDQKSSEGLDRIAHGKSASDETMWTAKRPPNVEPCTTWDNEGRKLHVTCSDTASRVNSYICYHKKPGQGVEVDWALLTSASFSQRAWGSTATGTQVEISTFEIGVLVWPELYMLDDTEGPSLSPAMNYAESSLLIPRMIPIPGNAAPYGRDEDHDEHSSVTIGLHVPYDFSYVRSELEGLV